MREKTAKMWLLHKHCIQYSAKWTAKRNSFSGKQVSQKCALNGYNIWKNCFPWNKSVYAGWQLLIELLGFVYPHEYNYHLCSNKHLQKNISDHLAGENLHKNIKAFPTNFIIAFHAIAESNYLFTLLMNTYWWRNLMIWLVEK